MTLYKQAICFICTHDIRAEKLDDVRCLWDDLGYSGRPVCNSCYYDLKRIIPDKLDVPLIRNSEPIEKIGLDKWI